MIGKDAVAGAMIAAGHARMAVNTTLVSEGWPVAPGSPDLRRLGPAEKAAAERLMARGHKIRIVARDVWRVDDEIMLARGLVATAKATAA